MKLLFHVWKINQENFTFLKKELKISTKLWSQSRSFSGWLLTRTWFSISFQCAFPVIHYLNYSLWHYLLPTNNNCGDAILKIYSCEQGYICNHIKNVVFYQVFIQRIKGGRNNFTYTRVIWKVSDFNMKIAALVNKS